MLVYAFRAGNREGVWTDEQHAAEVLAYVRQYGSSWLDRRGPFFFDHIATGATSATEAELTIPPRWHRVVSHTLAHRERSEPDTLFIAAISNADYKRLIGQALSRHHAKQEEIRRVAKKYRRSKRDAVRWEQLSTRLRSRLRGENLSPEKCWIWKPAKHLSRKTDESRKADAAPYRDFYIAVHGALPTGVVLRHTCDNRHCMNPNHLVPGSLGENVADMMKRGRHYRQVASSARARRRRAALRRKKPKKCKEE